MKTLMILLMLLFSFNIFSHPESECKQNGNKNANTQKNLNQLSEKRKIHKLLEDFLADSIFHDDTDPFQGMSNIREKMKKYFNSPQNGIGGFDDFFNDWSQKSNQLGIGDIERKEDDKYVYLTISIKGLKEQDIKVDIKGDRIIISGEQELTSQNNAANSKSRSMKKTMFSQNISVPDGVDVNKMELASGKDEIIIKFPKVFQKKKTRRLPLFKGGKTI